jgi:hypothetical protein
MRQHSQSGSISILLCAIMALMAVHILVSVRHEARLKEAFDNAEAPFAAAHPFNRQVLSKYKSYLATAALANARGLPAPAWTASECEMQTFGLLDHERFKGMLPILTEPLFFATSDSKLSAAEKTLTAPSLSPECARERAQFASEGGINRQLVSAGPPSTVAATRTQ